MGYIHASVVCNVCLITDSPTLCESFKYVNWDASIFYLLPKILLIHPLIIIQVKIECIKMIYKQTYYHHNQYNVISIICNQYSIVRIRLIILTGIKLHAPDVINISISYYCNYYL